MLACAYCRREENSEADKSTFKLCSGCYKVYYCNKDCQLADRKYHKIACKSAQSGNLNSTPAPTPAPTLVLSENLRWLIHYCNKGDVDGLQREISKGVDLNSIPSDYLFAAFNNMVCGPFYECADLLLQNNFNPNVKNISGYSPLFSACSMNREDFVSLLLQYNADPNIRTNDGFSPLHMACKNGYDKCASLLLQHNANPNIKDFKTESSSLHTACFHGYDKCVSLLLQHNANPNIKDLKNDSSPLHTACFHGHDKCVSLLLQYKANPNIIGYKNDGSPLHTACQHGHDKCVSLLLEHKADPNLAENNHGVPPLLVACEHGYDKCLSLLLKAGGNPEKLDKSGQAPFLGACFFGHMKCAAMLVEHGTNIHVKTIPQWQSALHAACLSRNVSLVEYIISLGVDINAKDAQGLTPIAYCKVRDIEKCAMLLIEHGADESTWTKSNPALVEKSSMLKEKLLSKTKELHLKAKHCDYPDCCNEGNDSQSLHACSSCHAVYYCSREHQEAHWKEHKKLCKAIKK